MIADPSSAYPSDPPITRAHTMTSAMWALGGAGARYLIAGATTLALTRLLDPADFGLIAIATLAQLLIEHILTTGFQDALIQRPALDRTALDSAFWSVLAVCGAAVVAVATIAQPLAAWFRQDALGWLLIGIALAALLRAVSTVPRALLHRRMAFRALALIRIAGLVIAGIGAVALAALGAGAWSLVAHVALLNSVTGAWIFRTARFRPTLAISRAALRHLWTFAPSVTVFTALSTFIANADDQIIGYWLGPQPLGYYALAYAFMAWPVQDVLGGTAVVVYPVFSRLQAEHARLHAAYYESLQLAALFAFPALTLLVITAPVLIRWLLGPTWQPMVLTVQILALGGLRAATGMLNGPLYRALGKPHLHTLLELASAPCYLVAFIVGVEHGIEGVALLFVLTGILLQPLSWLLLAIAGGIVLRRWFAALATAAVGTLLLALAAFGTLYYTAHMNGFSDAARLTATAIAAGGVYLSMILLTRPPALTRLWRVLKMRLGVPALGE